MSGSARQPLPRPRRWRRRLRRVPWMPSALALVLLAFAAQGGEEPTGGAAGFSAPALYNLGNSFARAGKPGLAVLNYERARLLAPEDPDIEANLRFVRNAAHLPVRAPSRFSRIATLLRPALLAWLGVLGILAAGTGLVWVDGRLRRPGLGRTLAAAGVLLLCATVSQGVLLWPTVHAAVVLADAAPVRVSPVPMGDELFTLPEAETVEVTAQHGDFTLIRTDAGKTGWIASAQLGRVVLR